MKFKLAILSLSLTLLSTTALAGPRIEVLNPTYAGISKIVRKSSTATYDSYAFKFETGPSPSSNGLFRTVRYDGASSNRITAISTRPGDFNPVNGNLLCGYPNELRDTSNRWTTDPTKTSMCILKPNTIYYFNVKSSQKCSGQGFDREACNFSLTGTLNK